jgi:hypothetical protein
MRGVRACAPAANDGRASDVDQLYGSLSVDPVASNRQARAERRGRLRMACARGSPCT